MAPKKESSSSSQPPFSPPSPEPRSAPQSPPPPNLPTRPKSPPMIRSPPPSPSTAVIRKYMQISTLLKALDEKMRSMNEQPDAKAKCMTEVEEVWENRLQIIEEIEDLSVITVTNLAEYEAVVEALGTRGLNIFVDKTCRQSDFAWIHHQAKLDGAHLVDGRDLSDDEIVEKEVVFAKLFGEGN